MDDELTAFCRAEHRRLVGALSLYCGDRHLAEELAQDTIIRVIDHWRSVRGLGSPSAWAHRVALNLANSHLRRRRAERRAVRRLSGRQETVQPESDTPVALAVRDAVSHLPRRERAVVRRVAVVVTAVGGVLSLSMAIPRSGPAPTGPTVVTSGPTGVAVPATSLPTGWSHLAPPPEVRLDGVTRWTGDFLLTWGGAEPAETVVPTGDGYIFDAGTGTWADLAPAPLRPEFIRRPPGPGRNC